MFHFLIARFTHTHTTLHSTNFLCHKHNCFSLLLFNSRSFSLLSNNQQGNSFTLSTLINSCGLSSETALKLSKRLKLRNPDGPNAVIQLFKSYGFSDSQLSSVVKSYPFVLLSNPEKTLLPKLKFFQSIGVSTIDLPKIIIGNTSFLKVSLEKNLIPRYEILRSLVCNDKHVVSALKNWTSNMYKYSMVNDDSLPNIELLRKLGVPQRCISLLVSNYPNVAFANHSRFVEVVNSIKEMGFDPSKSSFVLAIRVIVSLDKENLESKFKIFERWGWSRDICFFAFQRQPQYVMISEEKIMKTMDFMVNDVGLTPEDIARCPGMLNRNLEKVLVARCEIVNILKSRGLIKSGLFISAFVLISDEKFLEKYVTPFQNDLPLLLDAYKAHRLD